MDDCKPLSIPDMMKTFLTVSVVVGFFGVLTALFFVHDVPAAVKDILLVMLGTLIGAFKEIYSYWIGSSAGSAQKDDTIAAQATPRPAGTPNDPVSVTDVK